MSEDMFMTIFPVRYQRSQRYVFAEDRERCIGAGVLLYQVLGLTEKDIAYNAFGKPYALKGPRFSISHSGDYVVLAFAPAAAGVDVEKVEETYMDIMPQVFTEEETAYVNNDSKRFYRIWTLKESLAKAVGEGLHMSMREVSVLELLRGRSILYKDQTWYGFTTDLGNETYVLSGVKNGVIAADIQKLEVR